MKKRNQQSERVFLEFFLRNSKDVSNVTLAKPTIANLNELVASSTFMSFTSKQIEEIFTSNALLESALENALSPSYEIYRDSAVHYFYCSPISANVVDTLWDPWNTGLQKQIRDNQSLAVKEFVRFINIAKEKNLFLFGRLHEDLYSTYLKS
ncbi:MAG: hypothetical protein RL660_30 [Bacteroidota bacterium]|jgi:hypothetical protein